MCPWTSVERYSRACAPMLKSAANLVRERGFVSRNIVNQSLRIPPSSHAATWLTCRPSRCNSPDQPPMQVGQTTLSPLTLKHAASLSRGRFSPKPQRPVRAVGFIKFVRELAIKFVRALASSLELILFRKASISISGTNPGIVNPCTVFMDFRYKPRYFKHLKMG